MTNHLTIFQLVCHTLYTKVDKTTLLTPVQLQYSKLHYNGLGYNRYSVNADFFLVPAEFLVISMSDDTVRMDSVNMEFHLLQTSFPVANTTNTLDTTDWDHNHVRHAYIIVTAVSLMAASWERPSSCCDYVTALDTSRRSHRRDQLILLLKTLVQIARQFSCGCVIRVTSNLLPLANRQSLLGWG